MYEVLLNPFEVKN